MALAATITTMAMLNPKSISIINVTKPTTKPVTLSVPKGLPASTLLQLPTLSTSLTGTAIAGAIFSTLSTCDSAFAVQQIAQIAEGDNRGLALLLPLMPAIAWVLFNILQPALNQINRMRTTKGIFVGLGLGGLAASEFMMPHASAAEIASIAEASGSDNRGTLLLLVVAPAVLWVLYNILQPALNQINKMRS